MGVVFATVESEDTKHSQDTKQTISLYISSKATTIARMLCGDVTKRYTRGIYCTCCKENGERLQEETVGSETNHEVVLVGGTVGIGREMTGVGKKVQQKGNVMDKVAKQAQPTGRKDVGGTV